MSDYRYVLHRHLDQNHRGVCVWVMLNPSTADATVDDPTIRRCMSFTALWGFARMTVVNLWPLRATIPADLLTAPDIRGDEQLQRAAVTDAFCEADQVVYAWGANAARVIRKRGEPTPLPVAALHPSTPVVCLGLTVHGAPKHPLYLASATLTEPFQAARRKKLIQIEAP